MRSSLTLLIISAWAVAAVAHAQSAAGTRLSDTQRTAIRPAAARAGTGPVRDRKPAGTSARSHRPPQHVTAAAKKTARARQQDGVLDLGTTDITGNKELPKVMVIVPWRSPSDAGGVVKPTDSLMNEVLGPVDRGVFQRRIRYYGQLNVTEGRAPARVAPVGDSH